MFSVLVLFLLFKFNLLILQHFKYYIINTSELKSKNKYEGERILCYYCVGMAVTRFFFKHLIAERSHFMASFS